MAKTQQKMSANEFCNVKDIREKLLYSKDNYLYCFVKIGFLNTALFSTAEFEMRTRQMTASFESDRKDFAYCSYPREIDLDAYKNYLKEKIRQEQEYRGLKKILNVLMVQASELSTSGENYEHQHYIKLWKYIPGNSSLPNARQELLDRANEFCQRYMSIGVTAEILREKDIIKLCNLFGNAEQAPFEKVEGNTFYTPITQIGQR